MFCISSYEGSFINRWLLGGGDIYYQHRGNLQLVHMHLDLSSSPVEPFLEHVQVQTAVQKEEPTIEEPTVSHVRTEPAKESAKPKPPAGSKTGTLGCEVSSNGYKGRKRSCPGK